MLFRVILTTFRRVSHIERMSIWRIVMRCLSVTLMILATLSMTACSEYRTVDCPVYTHETPNVVALSNLSDQGSIFKRRYQYTQDKTTGLCFIERNMGNRGGIAQIPCETIPTTKPN